MDNRDVDGEQLLGSVLRTVGDAEPNSAFDGAAVMATERGNGTVLVETMTANPFTEGQEAALTRAGFEWQYKPDRRFNGGRSDSEIVITARSPPAEGTDVEANANAE